MKDWLAIATEIELNYSTFDGFIVLHGTDTMCYTSSALSFLLEDLGKTVVRAIRAFCSLSLFDEMQILDYHRGSNSPISGVYERAPNNQLKLTVLL
jgi:hypothetical protein